MSLCKYGVRLKLFKIEVKVIANLQMLMSCRFMLGGEMGFKIERYGQKFCDLMCEFELIRMVKEATETVAMQTSWSLIKTAANDALSG